MQQQAQLMLNQQKLDEVKKMAKATKMAVKSSAKSAKSTSSSVSKGSLGTIGDLRSKYRQDLNNDVTIKGLFSSHFSLLVNHKHMFTYV